jgi:hypothetical protein
MVTNASSKSAKHGMHGMRSRVQVPSKLRGAVAVEAAYAIPLFFVSFFAAVFLLIIAYSAVTLQFVVGELVREIGTRSPNVTLTRKSIAERAYPWVGGVDKIEIFSQGDYLELSDAPIALDSGDIFTIRITASRGVPLVGALTLTASAVGVMERL